MSTTLESPPAPGPGTLTPQRGVGGYLKDYVDRVRGGEVGALPAVFGLVALVAIFTAMRPVFLTSGNFANLLVQGASVTVIAMGLVFVLLMGDIDLSAGYTSGVGGALLAVLLTQRGWPWPTAVGAALLAGVVIGLTLGTIVSRVGIPSFVVTLAFFLGLQGAVLIIVGQGGNIPVRDDVVLSIANDTVSPLLGWLLWLVLVGGYAAVTVGGALRRRSRGLVHAPLPVAAAKVVGLAVITGVAVYALNLERSLNPQLISLRGIPVVVPVIALLLVVLTFALTRTSWGRHLYAAGGNAEAARRAGIDVARIRTSAFVIGSTLAAFGGIIAASRANSVDPAAGGGNILLYAVGAAVIGGTSLFGGKGHVRDAIIGGAVIAVIDNGMGLLGYSAGVRFVVTGVVLLVAAGVDALSRRRAAAG